MNTTDAKALYLELQDNRYCSGDYEKSNRGEEMEVVKEVICGYWKPRYLVDHRNHTAVEWINRLERLCTVTEADINWNACRGLSESARERAKNLNFHFPSYIYPFEGDIAMVQWQLNPDGRYYQDEDGFGMTDDVEENIYGYINREGKVVRAFQMKEK